MVRGVEESGMLESSKERKPCVDGKVLCQMWIQGMHRASKGARSWIVDPTGMALRRRPWWAQTEEHCSVWV